MSGKDGYTTKGREQILRFLEANPEREIEVSEIYDFLVSTSVQVGTSTIYSYMNRLTARGAVLKHKYGSNGKITFEYIGGRRGCCSHLHLKCTKCGRIQHLDCVFMKDVLNHIKEDHGFVVDCSESLLTGLCRQCAAYEQARLDITLEECKHCNENPDKE